MIPADMQDFGFLVTLIRFGPPEHGVWCDTCLLPSAQRQEFRLVTAMTVIGGARVTVCEECGTYDTAHAVG